VRILLEIINLNLVTVFYDIHDNFIGVFPFIQKFKINVTKILSRYIKPNFPALIGKSTASLTGRHYFVSSVSNSSDVWKSSVRWQVDSAKQLAPGIILIKSLKLFIYAN
jgi:hypothetical protein